MSPAFIILASVPLLAAAIIDIRRRIIPDWCVVMLGSIGLMKAALVGQPDAQGVAAVTSALAAGGMCALPALLLGQLSLWGWGDAKLVMAGGVAVGMAGLPLLLLGMGLAGGGMALLLLLVKGPVQQGQWQLPAHAPRWLVAEQRRQRLAPTVP
jgi:prepilin peptidase CpaA